jgi:phospholipid/cholesterol/gamma-HCH transport system substrate-binding protein
METRANFALIGAFTLAVIAAAFGFVFWFSGPSKATRRAPLDIVFNGSVAGLVRGGGVTFNGLRVGEVKFIELNPANPSEVIAHVDVERLTPLKTDTRARLEYQGLTGVAVVALTGGAPDAPALAPPAGASAPLIHAENSQFQDLMVMAQRIGDKVTALSDRATKLLDDNSQSLSTTIKNVEKFSAALGENPEGLKELMAAVGDLGRAAKPMIANIQELAKDADAVVKAVNPGQVKTIVSNVESASGKLTTTLGSLSGFLDGNKGQGGSMFSDVSDAARSIKRVADNLDVRMKEISANIARFSNTGLKQYEALAVDGRKTLGDISRAVRSLESDPSQVIFGAKKKLPEYNGQ